MGQDSFFDTPDDTATILKPSPGGTQVRSSQPRPAPPPPGMYRTAVLTGDHATGINPLEAAAASLLEIACRLHAAHSHSDPDGLRNQLVEEIKAFEVRARHRQVPAQQVLWARYVLCTVLDEVVLGKPWGDTTAWRTHSLLNTFHNDTQGGEKFFVLLNQASQDPAANIDLLEFMYVCLMLGFEGRYRIADRGREQLDALCGQLHELIRAQRGEYERELSPHWQGIAQPAERGVHGVPLWVTAAVAGVLLLATFIGLNFSLNSQSDPLFSQLHAIGIAPSPLEARPAPPEPARPSITLPILLQPEIGSGQISIAETPGITVVTVHGDGLFRSGSDQLSDSHRPLILRIAEALEVVPGQIVISGHTDNVPMRSLRYPSNWHLSEARADSVRTLIIGHIGSAARIVAEGRADTEPLVPNDSAENRARNRRVEIMLVEQPIDG